MPPYPDTGLPTTGDEFSKYFASRWNNTFNKPVWTPEYTRQQIPASTLAPLAAAGPALGNTAYKNLFDILSSGGKTDPAAMNRDIAGISRNSQIQQQDFAGQMAAMGLGGSGVAQAIGQAIGQGGNEKIADRRAQETQQAEARKRQDLELFLNMVTNPGLSALAGAAPPQQKGPSSTEQALQYAALFASMFG